MLRSRPGRVSQARSPGAGARPDHAVLAPASGISQSLKVGDLHAPRSVSAVTLLQAGAGPQQQPDEPLQLSLEQAIRMALESNLDIQLEQVDQEAADFSLERTQGGGTPRPINYNIAEAPVGEIIPAMPLLASTGPTISPYGIQPAGVISVSPSYDIGHVLQAQRSLSLATGPFSAGSPVPYKAKDLLHLKLVDEILPGVGRREVLAGGEVELHCQKSKSS